MRPTGEPQKDEQRYLSPRSSGWWRGCRAAKAPRAIHLRCQQSPPCSPQAVQILSCPMNVMTLKKCWAILALKYNKKYLSFIWIKSESVKSRMVAAAQWQSQGSRLFPYCCCRVTKWLPQPQTLCPYSRECIQEGNKKSKEKKCEGVSYCNGLFFYPMGGGAGGSFPSHASNSIFLITHGQK